MSIDETAGTRCGAAPWTLHEDRALPAEPGLRAIAREILTATQPLPIVSMHGHVEASLLADDLPFTDPASLLVTPDHYLTRMLVSQRVAPEAVGLRTPGGPAPAEPRDVWRTFCASWPLLRGTPTRYWLEHVLVEVFGVTERPSRESADRIYDHVSARLAEPQFRPLELLDRFGIELLATTDSSSSPLTEHATLAARGADHVVPTFRPDVAVRLDGAQWRDEVARLEDVTGRPIGGYRDLVAALEERRAAFVAAGARATDHGAASADTRPLSASEADRLVQDALRGSVTKASADAFEAHMLHEMARMSAEDGLVMQLHPGVLRNYDRAALGRYGADIGYDIPLPTDFVRGLRPLLESFGHHPRLTLVVFTVDEDTFTRELAPLAGVYPAMRLGAPWWFLDTPDGLRRFREAVTDTAGFANTTGFVDDTRAFCSIPARHDLARRIDAGFLARLVAEHRLDLDEAVETAVDLAYHLPRSSYPPLTGGRSAGATSAQVTSAGEPGVATADGSPS